MLLYNEIKEKTCIELEGTPYEVLSSHIFRKQQRKPVNQTKLKNLLTGKVIERSFHQSEKVEEANMSARTFIFIYKDERKGEFWFKNPTDASDRFSLSSDVVGEKEAYLKTNETYQGIIFQDAIIGLKLPIKMDLRVKEAPPSERGNTAQGGTKQVLLETGASINVPLFVNEGDVVRINTDTGEYVERVR